MEVELREIPQGAQAQPCPFCAEVPVYRVDAASYLAVDGGDPRQQHPTSRTDGVGHIHAFHRVPG